MEGQQENRAPPPPRPAEAEGPGAPAPPPLASHGPRDTEEAGPERSAQEALRRFRAARAAPRDGQLDLNDPRNLSDLEDPGLKAHMDQARLHLASAQAAAAAAPTVGAVAEADRSCRCGMSELSCALKEAREGLQLAAEEALYLAGCAESLAAGEAPRGFSPHGGEAQALLARKLRAVGEAVAAAAGRVEAAERGLTVTRRQCEAALSGLRRPEPGPQ